MRILGEPNDTSSNTSAFWLTVDLPAFARNGQNCGNPFSLCFACAQSNTPYAWNAGHILCFFYEKAGLVN